VWEWDRIEICPLQGLGVKWDDAGKWWVRSEGPNRGPESSWEGGQLGHLTPWARGFYILCNLLSFRTQLIHHPDDGSSMHLCNVSQLQYGYTVLYPRLFILATVRTWNFTRLYRFGNENIVICWTLLLTFQWSAACLCRPFKFALVLLIWHLFMPVSICMYLQQPWDPFQILPFWCPLLVTAWNTEVRLSGNDHETTWMSRIFAILPHEWDSIFKFEGLSTCLIAPYSRQCKLVTRVEDVLQLGVSELWLLSRNKPFFQ
jgi:hypothetical protein